MAACAAQVDAQVREVLGRVLAQRRSAEETFKTGKDVLGWDQPQIQPFEGTCRHTALRGQP